MNYLKVLISLTIGMVFTACITLNHNYISYKERLDTIEPDGQKILKDIIDNAVNKGLIDNDPLVVIDAIVLDNDQTIEYQYKYLFKEDIEDISVLDGKQAVEIYGEDAKNGLVLISRKKEAKKYLKHYQK